MNTRLFSIFYLFVHTAAQEKIDFIPRTAVPGVLFFKDLLLGTCTHVYCMLYVCHVYYIYIHVHHVCIHCGTCTVCMHTIIIHVELEFFAAIWCTCSTCSI
jgi:hypothetical protein